VIHERKQGHLYRYVVTNVPYQKSRNTLALSGNLSVSPSHSLPLITSASTKTILSPCRWSQHVSPKLIVYPPYTTKNCRTKDLPQNSAKMESEVYFAFVSKCHVSNCNYSTFTVQLTSFARVFNLYQSIIQLIALPLFNAIPAPKGQLLVQKHNVWPV
jgi:hypothetical protein